MEAKLFGIHVQQDCPNCSDRDEYITIKDTPCELLITNTSRIRSDIRVWIQNEKVGTWAIGGNDEISLVTFPMSNGKNEIRFYSDTVITVKFFQAFDNEISMDRELQPDEIINVVTRILIVRVTDFTVFDEQESVSYYSLVL